MRTIYKTVVMIRYNDYTKGVYITGIEHLSRKAAEVEMFEWLPKVKRCFDVVYQYIDKIEVYE